MERIIGLKCIGFAGAKQEGITLKYRLFIEDLIAQLLKDYQNKCLETLKVTQKMDSNIELTNTKRKVHNFQGHSCVAHYIFFRKVSLCSKSLFSQFCG